MGPKITSDPTVDELDLVVTTSRTKATLQLLTVGLGALVVSMSHSMLIPVLGTLPSELDTSVSNVNWLLTATLLVGSVAVPIMGRLGDMFGKKLMMLVALGALTAGSVLTAVTESVPLLIAGRAVQGISFSAISLGISLLSTTMPKERAGYAIALVSAMLGVGGSLGLPLGGLVAQFYSFQALFWITATVGLVSMVGIARIVPESPIRTGGRVDLVGALLLSASLVSLMLPLAQGSSWGWADQRTVGLLALSAVLLSVFTWSQTRIREPLVDLRAFRRRPIVLTNLASILFGFALFASMIGTAAYVEAPEASGYGFGSSLLVGGLVMAPSGIAMLLLSPFAARLIDRRGGPQTLMLGALVVAAGWVMRIVVSDSMWQIVVGTTAVGIGSGIGYAAMPALINANTPAHELAAANGLNALCRSLGSALAAAIGGGILAADTIFVGTLEMPSVDAYRGLFALCGGAAVLAALVILFLPGQEPARDTRRASRRRPGAKL